MSNDPRGNQPSYQKKQIKLYEMCHDYLIDNFHKFTDTNKIKVSLAITQKLVPQKVESDFTFNKTPDVYMDGSKMEFKIGTESVKHPGETSTDNNEL